MRTAAWRVQLYVAGVALLGAGTLWRSIAAILETPPSPGWLVLAVLTWVSGAFAVKIPSVAATISVSEVFVFTLVILFGEPVATITLALDGLATSLYRGNRQPHRLLFNIAEPALSIWVAAAFYRAAGGPAPLSTAPATLTMLVVPVLVLTTGYLMLNSWLTAAAVGLESRRSIVSIWKSHIVWLSINFVAGGSIALLLAVNMPHVNLQGLALILPLVLTLYLVFRNWSVRIQEAEAHVAAVDRLYVSTVEAFATAIESKDEVTHDHVRRVKTLSLAIAKHLRITDAETMRALESGSLLHDIGKVAIPDYILHKPDKLTAAEYDLIKLHAPIGAEILTTIEFPYPVVPIVRHHHECWDGSGYPDGIAGEAIPIGARIISVVDCFDALTSDRPYRRALTDDAALGIIRAGSGTKFDPLVVDALLATHTALRSLVVPSAVSTVSELITRANRPLDSDAQSTGPLPRPVLHTATNDWDVTEGAWRLAAQVDPAKPGSVETAFALLAQVLREDLAATTITFATLAPEAQRLVVTCSSGHGEQCLRGQTVRLGDGVAGWVAVNGRAIVNANPALDFALAVSGISPTLASTLAVPVGRRGVLSFYSDRANAFCQRDQMRAEQAATRLSQWLSGEAPFSGDRHRVVEQEPTKQPAPRHLALVSSR